MTRTDSFSAFVLWPSVAERSTLSEVVQEHLREPLTLRTDRWQISLPADIVEQDLVDRYGAERDQDGRLRARPSFLNELTVEENGDIVSQRLLPGLARPLLLIGLLSIPVAYVFGLTWLYAGYFLLGILLPTKTHVPTVQRREQPRRIARRASPLPGAFMSAGMVGIWVAVRSSIALPVLEFAVLLALVVQIAIMYLENALPGVSTGVGETVLYVPLLGLLHLLITLGLFFVLHWLLASMYLLAESWVDFLLPGITRTKAGIYADLSGITIGWGEDPSRELLMAGILSPLREILPYFFGALILLHLLRVSSSWGIEKRLRRTRLTDLSDVGRYVVLGGTLVLNVVILVGFVVALDILLFGALDLSLLSPSIYTPLVEFYAQDAGSVTGAQFLDAIYDTYAILFAYVPAIPGEIASLVIPAVFLFPFVSLGSLTVHQLVVRPVRGLWVYYVSEPLPDEDLPDDWDGRYPVRVIRSADYVDLRPFWMWFGLRRYVCITQRVATELDPEHLAAAIRHEEYHLDNRDHPVVAALLSLGVGGQNALLAFYDYPRLEREADRHAAATRGYTTTLRAIHRLYDLKQRSDATGRLPSPAAGFVATPDEKQFHRTLADAYRRGKRRAASRGSQLWHGVRRGLVRLNYISGSPERLFFGSVLKESAHYSLDERLEALETWHERADPGDG
jgi:hypothetical protein